MSFITDVILNNPLLLVPKETYRLINTQIKEGSAILLDVIEVSVSNFGTNLGYTMTTPFILAWNWVLYNILTPLILMVFLIGFFIGQYYLIKLYFKMFRLIVLNIIKLFNLISKSPKIQSFITKIEDDFIKFNS